MATIKAYTDLSQSKVLAEILSLESADMYWDLLSKDNYAKVNNIGHCLGRTCVYAWSLGALLDVLPRKVELEDTAYTIGVSLDSINYSNVNNGNLLLEVKVKDNLVDACYEVIIKLYELKML